MINQLFYTIDEFVLDDKRDAFTDLNRDSVLYYI